MYCRGNGLDGRGSIRQGQEFLLYSTASRPALGPIQTPIQWVPGVKLTTPSSAEIENYRAVSLLPVRVHVVMPFAFTMYSYVGLRFSQRWL
jgi:hypothetical protein